MANGIHSPQVTAYEMSTKQTMRCRRRKLAMTRRAASCVPNASLPAGTRPLDRWSFAGEPHAGIDRDGTVCVHDHGVQIELHELGNELDQCRDPDQDVDQRCAVRRGGTSEAVEQRPAAKLVNHL